jgi:hypothetical protein
MPNILRRVESNFLLNYNICRVFFVCEAEMTRVFRVTGRLEQQQVLWLVNRSGERGTYALDELFTEEEVAGFEKLLESRNQEYRIEEILRSLHPEELPSWNLIGRVFELEDQGADQLSFRVVGCVEA